MSRLHKHGFNFARKDKAPEQLCQLLEMDEGSPEFRRIEDHLLHLTTTHLKPNINGRRQMKTLVKVEELLKKDLPDVFGGEENISARRLYFAVRVMLHFHRKRFKGNMNKIPTLEAAPDIILDLTNERTDSEAEDHRDESPMGSSNAQPDPLPQDPPPNIVQKREQSSVPSHVVPSAQTLFDVMELDREPSPITTEAPIQAASSSSSHPSESRHQSASAPNSLTPDSSSNDNSNASRLSIKKKQVKRIRSFLLSCSPPLGHLLSRFIDIGFTSTAILLEVASNWTKDERMELLKELPLGPNGVPVTQLELMALERRFQRSIPHKE